MNKDLYKHPKLYEAFDLYSRQWCDDLPTDEALSQITFSPAFEEKMRRVLRRQAHGFYVLFGTARRCVASVLITLLVGMTITTFSVKALREPVVRFITRVFDSFTSILFVDDEPSDMDTEMKTVEPGYIPQGYEVEQAIGDNSTMYRIRYYNADTKSRLVYTQRREETGALGINTEDVDYHSVKVNELEGIAYSQGDTTAVMFVHGIYTFTVKGSLSEAELLRIAASVPLN